METPPEDADEGDEKRKSDDPRKLTSKKVTDELERELIEIGGFSKKALFNRRGGIGDRGLAALLEAGDTIVEVLPGQVRIKTREGTIQTFYDLEREQDFLKRVPDLDK